MIQRFSIAQVAQATGLEECEIRFFEQVFREFLTFRQGSPAHHEYSRDHIDLLHRIRQSIHEKGCSIEDVKRELRVAFAGYEGVASQAVASHSQGLDRDVPSDRLARAIALTSGKGGVGKTTLTVNLALAFARAGKRVAIFDADPGLASVHNLMGLKSQFNPRAISEEGLTLEDLVTTGPEGVRIIHGGQGIHEMASLTDAQRQSLLRQLDQIEREVDILLIDTGTGISEHVLRFAAYADEILVVTTPSIAAAADSFSMIKVLREMTPDSRIGLIPNMCQSIYHAQNVFKRVNTATRKYLRYSLGNPGYIASDLHAEFAGRTYKPLLLEFPHCEAAQCFRALADTILHDRIFAHDHMEASFEELLGSLHRTAVGV